jgi:zinc D-Ala-D-Ala dipeptidase
LSRTAIAAALMCAHGVAVAPPEGFVEIGPDEPGIALDIRYATSNNFTGRIVPGYGALKCWLRQPAAEALRAAARDFAASGHALVLFDCYRPKRAVEAFVAWTNAPDDPTIKARYYPDIDKSALLGRYIGRRSTHATGTAVDLGLLKDGRPVDFGSAFDVFGPISHIDNAPTAQARANRLFLAGGLAKHGFRSYPAEWWHFSFPLAGAEAIDRPIE